MPEKRWKAQERRVARLLGAKRNPRNGSTNPDATSRDLVIENKDRRRFPQWIVAALAQARTKAPSHKLPIVTVTNADSLQILVIMDLMDFKAWFV